MGNPLLMLSVGFYQDYYLRAIFGILIDGRRIKADRFFTIDSVTAAAGSFMLRNPDLHVAIIVETESRDPDEIREIYESACRRIDLHISWARDRWHVAVAMPDLRAWAVIDDRVRQEYEKIRQDPAAASTPEEHAKIDQANYRALASKIGEWTAERPFDLEKLKRESRQVRELCAFIHKSQHPEPKPVLATAADWF